MHPREDPTPALHQLAVAQAGVVTRIQAASLGVGRHGQERLVRQGHWQRLARGTLLTHGGDPSWHALAWAGVLGGGERARLGGLAAGYASGLVDTPPERIVVLVPQNAGRRDRPPWSFHREQDGIRHGLSVGDPPRTRIEDTVLDLCTGCWGPSGHPPLHWLTLAIQRRLTTSGRLRDALSNRSRITGRPALTELLADTADGAQSPLEHRYLRNVELGHGLPRGKRQHAGRAGALRVRRDVHYEQYRVIVELDGHTGHTGSDRFRDFRRDNAALMTGEVTLRFGWHDVDSDPCQVAHQVAELLVRGGWTGFPTPCRRCAQ